MKLLVAGGAGYVGSGFDCWQVVIALVVMPDGVSAGLRGRPVGRSKAGIAARSRPKGKNPLSYHPGQRLPVFASEIEGLLASTEFPREWRAGELPKALEPRARDSRGGA